MMPPTVDEVARDPEFQSLPWGERHKVLQTIDPEYAALPTNEQASALDGMKKLPFWQGNNNTPSAAVPTPIPQGNVEIGDITIEPISDMPMMQAHSSKPPVVSTPQPTFATPQPRDVMGVSPTNAKIFQTPEERVKSAGDLAGTAIDLTMGVSDGMTLGLTKPITDKARTAMPSLGMAPNPVASVVGNMAGTIAPWSAVSKGVSAATGLNNLTKAGRFAEQALTGGIVGGVAAQNLGLDAVDNSIAGGLFAATITGAMEIPGMARWFKGLSASERDTINVDLRNTAAAYADQVAAGKMTTRQAAKLNKDYFKQLWERSRKLAPESDLGQYGDVSFNPELSPSVYKPGATPPIEPVESFVNPPQQQAPQPPTLDYTKTLPAKGAQNRYNFELGAAKNPTTTKAVVELPPETTPDIAKGLGKSTGLAPIRVGDAFYLVNTQKASVALAKRDIKAGTHGNLLGYGTESIPENGVPWMVDLNGHGSVDANEIAQSSTVDKIGISGVAPDMQTAIAKITEFGRNDAEIRGVPEIDQKGEIALDTEPRETEVTTPQQSEVVIPNGEEEGWQRREVLAPQPEMAPLKLDAFGEEVMQRPGDTVTLYHGGSSDNHAAILQEGIKPNKKYGLGLAEPEINRSETIADQTDGNVAIKGEAARVAATNPLDTITPKSDTVFTPEEIKQRINDGLYYHDEIPARAQPTDTGSPLETAASVARRSLRTVRPADGIDFSRITDDDARKAAASGVRQAEADALRAHAEQNNLIIPDFEANLAQAGNRGGTENHVYRDPNTGRWLKANFFTYSPTFTDLFNRVKIHNADFPLEGLRFEGFADVKGEFTPVFSQEHFQETPNVDPKVKEQAAADTLVKMGYKRVDGFGKLVSTAKFVSDDGVVIRDVNSRNVVMLPNGEIVFIDPVIIMEPGTKAQRVASEEVSQQEPFSRLSPSGKRGSKEAFTVNVSPSKMTTLQEIWQEISDGEAGKRMATNMEQNATGTKEQVAWGSTYPEYFQNKNLTKKQVLPVIERILKGESVTEAQWLMVDDMLQAKRYDTLNKILSDRATKYAKSDTSISDLSNEELLAANQVADDFFAQFGGKNETTDEAVGSVRQDATREAEGSTATSGGEARDGEAATTERIDESGWRQQVDSNLRGDKKPLQFGDKKPSGRNVGLSEFTDGFTPDPQQDIFSTPSFGSKTDTPPPVPESEPIIREFDMKADDADLGTIKMLVTESRLAGEVTFNLDNGGKIVARQKDKYLHATVHYPSGKTKTIVENSKGTFTETAASHYTTGGKSHADAGGYSERTPPMRETTQTFIEMPELVKIGKMINDGKLPKLVERLGNAIGRFIGDEDGNALIKLRKDIFAGPQIATESFKTKDARGKWDEWQKTVTEDNPDADIIFRQKYNKSTGNVDFKAYKRDPNFAAKVFSHEIGHFGDYLKDNMIFGRGNIFGHIAALKKYAKDTLAMYPDAKGEALTRADKERLAEQAKSDINAHAGEDIVETITREVPKYAEAGVTPEMITEIWNGMDSAREKNPDLYKFIAKMSDAEKKQVVVQAMKGVVHESLKRLGRVQVGTETITETVTRKAPVSKEAIKRRTEQLIKEEILKRRLYEKDVVMDELKALTQIWKPFDDTANAKYTKYRYSPAELYADATSVLFNEPQLLKDTAPTFYKAFFYYMGERPQFQEAYKAISRLSKDPQALGADRYAEEMGMYERGNAKMEEIRKNQKPGEKLYDTAMRWFIDKNHDVLKDLPDTPAGRNARYMLEEIPYIAGEAENYVRKAHDIRLNVEAEGATIDDLSAYMLAKHIISNRSDIANTAGKTAATEQAKLDWMRQNMGERKFAVLEQAAEQFKEVRQHVITRMEESGIVTPELLKRIKENPEYAHIEVQKYLDKKYGAGTAAGAGWKKMAEGTLEDVTNVYTATVLQDISIMRMAKINEAKAAVTQVFAQSGLANVAPMKYNAAEKGMRPDTSKVERDQALLTVLKDGKPIHYIVDKHVADMYQYDPVKAMNIGKVFGFITTYYRDILVSKNPAWMARNLYRDFKGTVKNNPEIAWWNPMDRVRLLKAYKQAFKESRADVFHNQRSADIEMMHNEHMLNADRMYSNVDESFDDPLIRMALEFNFGSQEPANVALAKLKKAYIYADKMGKVSEQTSKIAGMKFLRDKGLSGNDLSHRVRTRIGTPDYKRQGSLQQFTNNIFLFSNVNKEGMRSAYEAFKEDPVSYSFKTIESNILPKLLMIAAGAGILDRFFGDDLSKTVNEIPSWIKRSYNVIPIPQALTDIARRMGIAGADDVGYIKLPSDYEGQFFGSLAYDLAGGNFKGVTEYLKGMLPYYPSKAHPFLRLAYDYGEYVASRGPYDPFRQKDVLTQEQQKYLDVQGPLNAKSAAGMGKHTWNMLGFGNVYQLENKEFPKQKQAEEAAFKQIMRYMGGFVEFTSAGKQEGMVKPLIEERNAKAIKSYEVGDVINESIREGKSKPSDIVGAYKALVAEGKIDRKKTSFGLFRSKYMSSLFYEKYGIRPNSKAEERKIKQRLKQ